MNHEQLSNLSTNSNPQEIQGQEGAPIQSHKKIGLLLFQDATESEPKLFLSLTNGEGGFSPISKNLEKDETFGIAVEKVLEEKQIELVTQHYEVTRTIRKQVKNGKTESELWRIYSGNVARETAEEGNWFTKNALESLAQKTQLRREGKTSDDEWRKNPGLDDKWYDFFQEIGLLDDPNQSQRKTLQPYYYGRTPITGRYYGKEFEQTQAAARALGEIGRPSYPKPNPDSAKLISESGDTFNFLGGSKLIDPPYKVQLGFFRSMRRTVDISMVDNSFCYVAIQDGYLGKTASIEVAYAMANKKRVIFSEPPTRFSSEAPDEVISLVKENYHRYPQLPISEVSTGLEAAKKYAIEYPNVSGSQEKVIFSSIKELIRDMKNKFGYKLK